MFGTILPDSLSLSKESRKVYKSFYCGLCQKIAEKYGNISRFALTYDLTFLVILLSSLYEGDSNESRKHCPIRLGVKQNCIITDYTDYCADMSILVTYYKCLDDVKDESSVIKKNYSERLKQYIPKIEEKYPRQSGALLKGLEALSFLEKEKCSLPDLPAAAFGNSIAELFVPDEDHFASTLYSIGLHLGKFVYLADAWTDRKKDQRKKNYNPFLLQPTETVTVMNSLRNIIAEVVDDFEYLPILDNIEILNNILHNGVWLKLKGKEDEESGQ